jgi:hypothetical protein
MGYEVNRTAKKAAIAGAETGGALTVLWMILSHFVPEVAQVPAPVAGGIVSLVSGACKWVHDWLKHRRD